MPYGGVCEVGGNKILVENLDVRILLDFGLSFKQEGTYFSGFLQPRSSLGLKDLFEFGILPKIPGLYAQDFSVGEDNSKVSIDACFISHAHLDHFGNLNVLHDDIPVFMGETSAKIIQSIQDTSRIRFKRPYIRQTSEEKPSNVRTFRTGDVIQIKGLEITPVHVDHSLPGSYGFFLEDLSTKKVLGYTGDLRLHGWRRDLTEDFITVAKKKNLDVLIIEGTNINEDFDMNELTVQKDISQAIAQTEGLAIANYSLRDIDRFRSFYLAAKENDRKLLINTKQAYLLKLLQDDPHLEIPPLKDPFIHLYRRVKTRYYQWEQDLFENENLITIPESDFDQREYVFHCDFWNFTDLIDIQPKQSTFLYSHGDPVDLPGMIDYNTMQEWIRHFHMDFKQYHASGHAPRRDLKKIVEEIDPELMIPIHTEHPEMYREIVDVPILLPTQGRAMFV